MGNKFQLPYLYAIANIDQLEDPFLYVQRLHSAGISLVQLRAKEISQLKFTTLAKNIIGSFPADDRPQFIINDNPKIVLAVGADGVHLGQSDCDPVEARELLGPKAIIGLSTHNEQQLLDAPYEALSYIAIGPIFRSATKSGHAPEIGIEQLSTLSKLAKRPIVAIGGITADNAAQVYRAGASSVAVIKDLMDSEDLDKTVMRYELASEE